MSDLQIVTGAGPVGWTVAEQLAAAGHRVRVLTRSGSGPEHPLGRAAGRRRLAAGRRSQRRWPGATAVFHCVHGSGVLREGLAPRAARPPSRPCCAQPARRVPSWCSPRACTPTRDPTEPMDEDNPRDWDHGKGAVRRDLLGARADSPTDTVSVVVLRLRRASAAGQRLPGRAGRLQGARRRHDPGARVAGPAALVDLPPRPGGRDGPRLRAARRVELRPPRADSAAAHPAPDGRGARPGGGRGPRRSWARSRAGCCARSASCTRRRGSWR